MYDFILNLNYRLNKDTATCIYTGIITDTGSLRYPNVTYKTHLIVSALLKFNIDHSKIHMNLFDSQNKIKDKVIIEIKVG